LTDNFLPLILRERVDANRWIRSRVERAENGELVGSLIESGVCTDSEILA